jgi:hypothetical protein
MRGQCVGGELVLAGGQQPSGTDTSRSTTNSRSSGGRSPTTQLPARVGHRPSGRLNDGGSPRGWAWTAWLATRSADCSRSCGWRCSWPANGTSARPRSCRQTRRGWRTKGGTRCLGRARQLYRASGLSPAQYESATKRRDGSIGPHSLQRVRRRSASTKRSTSRSLRPIPARIAHRRLLRATARTLVLRADATVLPHRGAAGMTLP